MKQNSKSHKGWQRAKAVIACSLALCLSMLGTPFAYAADSTSNATTSKSLRAGTIEVDDIKDQIIEAVVDAYYADMDGDTSGEMSDSTDATSNLLTYLQDTETSNGKLPPKMTADNYNTPNYEYSVTYDFGEDGVFNSYYKMYMYTVKAYPVEPSVTITDGDTQLVQGVDRNQEKKRENGRKETIGHNPEESGR
jgi:hypothetical protein